MSSIVVRLELCCWI